MELVDSIGAPRAENEIRFAATPSFGGFATLSARFRAHRYPPHAHDHFAVGVVVGGLEHFDCGGVRYDAGPGCLVLVNPEQTHCAWTGEGGYAYRMLYPDPATLAAAARSCGVSGEPCFADAVVRDPSTAQALLRAVDAVEMSAEPLARDEAVAAAFAALARRHGGGIGGARRTRPSAEPRGVARARARLDDAPAEPLDLPTLADLVELSPFALIRAFKRATGMTPGAYLRARRVTLAQNALRRGEACAAVAADLGFADQAHLTRAFKAIVGTTPGAYQAAWRAAA